MVHRQPYHQPPVVDTPYAQLAERDADGDPAALGAALVVLAVFAGLIILAGGAWLFLSASPQSVRHEFRTSFAREVYDRPASDGTTVPEDIENPSGIFEERPTREDESADPAPPASADHVTPSPESAEHPSVTPENGSPAEASAAEPSEDRSPTPDAIVDMAGRPEWVDREPYVDDKGIWYIPVGSGPATTRQEARQKLQRAIELAVVAAARERIVQHGKEAEGAPLTPADLPRRWTKRFTQAEFLIALTDDRHYEETIESPRYGTFYQSHALVRLEPHGPFEQRVNAVVREARAIHHAWRFVFEACAVLAVLLLAWLALSLPFPGRRPDILSTLEPPTPPGGAAMTP